MKVICGHRKTSRTTTLIEWCHEAERVRGEISYIVCQSQEEARRIHQRAIEMGKPVAFPITYDEFRNSDYFVGTIKNFFFDNADKFIQLLTPVHIEAIVVEKTDYV